MEGRTKEEILDDLVSVVMDHEYNRDCEWSFCEEKGYSSEYWTDEDIEEHNRILEAIAKTHDRLVSLAREATGSMSISF